MMRTRISFVMPAFNAEAYVAEAIDSIEAQTCCDWELVVVDDCSTDRTAEIVASRAKYNDRIKLLSTAESSGSAFLPRRIAIEAAQGEFVVAVDADDTIAPDYLDRLLAVQSATGADEVVALMVAYEHPHGPVTPWQAQQCADFVVRTGRECLCLTLDGWRIGLNGALIRRDLMVRAYGLYGDRPAYSCADELLTRMQLSLAEKVGFTSARYYYRSAPDSVTRRRARSRFDFLLNNLALLEYTCETYGAESEEYALAQSQNFHGVFEAYRTIRRGRYSRAELGEEVCGLIQRARQAVDFRLLKKRVSPRYHMLLRQRLLPVGPLLALIDRALRIK
ncbi:MAG: glycosyltransferase [Muribaculaceae bacterium]|nr:glycosyltransferase [Muribaculaceae bacterium]